MEFNFKRKKPFNVKRITYLSRTKCGPAYFDEPKTPKSLFMESFYSLADISKINGLYYLRRTSTLSTV